MFHTEIAGGLGIRIVQIPASVQSNPLSGIYIVNRLLPSSVFSQRIEVSNSTNLPMDVSLYPGAATNLHGVFAVSPGATPNQLTSWITLSPSSGTIAPHSYMDALVTFNVPDTVVAGEQYGVIWASISSKANHSGFMSVNRVGIRMYVPIGKEVKNISASTTATSTSVPKEKWSVSHQSELQWSLIVILLGTLIYIWIKSIEKKWKKKLKNKRKAEKRKLEENITP